MKKLLSKLDKPLLVVTFIFFIFGLIMILSASSMESYMRYNYSPYHYFIRQGVFLLAGFFMFLVMINFSTKSYGFVSWFLLIVFSISLVVLLAIFLIMPCILS